MDRVRDKMSFPVYQPHARSTRKLWAEEVAEALERRNQGETLESVADSLDVHETTLQTAIKRAERYGYMTCPPRPTGE